jgi:DNA-binding LacI/PurR family transcriptional regulator
MRMKIEAKNCLPYLQACQDLRKQIQTLADRSGRLFSERLLCERLSVSRGTLRKALAELRSEGYIHSERQLNYVSGLRANRDIGILLDCYKAAPYLPDPVMVCGIMAEMAAAGYHGRLLVPNAMDGVAPLVEQYNLRGLLWLNPPRPAWPEIVNMGLEKQIKVCCLLTESKCETDSPLQVNYVSLDRDYQGEKRARHFLEMGHRRVAYLGSADSTYKAFVKEMAAHGAESAPAWRLDQPAQIVQQLARLVKCEKITGIAANGGMVAVSMFEALSTSHPAPDLDILLPYTRQIHDLVKKNPAVKVAQFTVLPDREFGSEVMKMLVRQIEQDRDQAPVLVKSRFVAPEEIPELAKLGAS